MRIGAIAVVLAFAACGRIDFDPLADGSPGGLPDTPACTFGPWSTPQPVHELSSTVADFGGQVTADGLGYYLQSHRSGTAQLWVAHRTDRQATWSTPVMLAELNTAAEQSEVAPVAGELATYFTSTRPSGTSADDCIWRADRASTSEPFGDLVRLDALCLGGRRAVGPYASLDELTLYYSSEEAQSFGSIFEAHRASRSDAFGVGTLVPGIETGPKGYPYVTPDALAIYYEAFGTGTFHHIFVATRTDPAAAFGPAVPVPNVDDDNDNEDVSLTADGREIFFASGRTGTLGEKDIFTATRACE